MDPVHDDETTEPDNADEVHADEARQAEPLEVSDVPHRLVETSILLAQSPAGVSGEVVVGEFAGSIDGCVAVVGDEETPFDTLDAEEVEVGVARVRVTSSRLQPGETVIRLSVVT